MVDVVSVSEKGAQFSITLPEIRHNKMTNEKGAVFDRFDFEGCGVWASGEGAPELPVYRTLIEVPDGVTVTASFGKAPSERLSESICFGQVNLPNRKPPPRRWI